MIAKKPFMAGSLLMSTPKSVMVTPDTARTSEMGWHFQQAGLPGCARGDGTSNDCTALLVFHIIEIYHNRSHPFARWMTVLPRNLQSPLFWNEDDYEELQGSNLYSICLGWKQSVSDLYKATIRELRAKFPTKFSQSQSKYTRKEFLWGWAIIWSRAFDIEIPISGGLGGGGQERQRVMAPIVDFFNHNLVQSNYRYNPVEQQFELYTGQSYKAGDEVFLNYDPKPNSDYLMQYGFVMDNNPHDYVGVIASIGPDAPHYADKNALLERLGHKMSAPHRLSMSGLSSKSLDCVRVLCAEPAEMLNGDARKVLRGKPISAGNELCLYRTLVDAIHNLLEQYPTKLVDDQALYQSASFSQLSTNARNALILRRGEKRILLFALSAYQRKLQQLADEAGNPQQQSPQSRAPNRRDTEINRRDKAKGSRKTGHGSKAADSSDEL